MGLDLQGWDNINTTLQSLGDVGNKISTSSFRKSLKSGLTIIKSVAPKDSGDSSSSLKVGKIKKYKSGSIWGSIGIDDANYEECKGLIFQHYGYEYYKNGKRYEPNAGWMDKATKFAEAPVLKQLETNILAELDKILK